MILSKTAWFSYRDGGRTVTVSITHYLTTGQVMACESGLGWPGLTRSTDLSTGEVWNHFNGGGDGDGPIGRFEGVEERATHIGGRPLAELAALVSFRN